MPTTSEDLRRRANPGMARIPHPHGAMVPVGDLDAAREAARRAEEAGRRYRAILQSVEPLFGRATYLALAEALEPLEDQSYEATRYFERAIAELEEHRDQLHRAHRQSEDKWMGAMKTAREAVGELLARHRRRKTEPPDWLRTLAHEAQLPIPGDEQEPF